MTNKINIQARGYVFNEQSGKLEAYEFKYADFRLGSETIEYHCLLGGVETTFKTDNLLQIFENEEGFKTNNPLKQPSVAYWKAERLLPVTRSSSKTWGFIDGQAIEVDRSEILLRIYADNNIVVVDGTKYYKSREDVYKWNDIVVKDADGTERVAECIAKKFALNEEQQALVTKLEETFKKLNESGVKIAYDCEECEIVALNINNVPFECIGWIDEYQDCYGASEFSTVINTPISYMGCDDDFMIKK